MKATSARSELSRRPQKKGAGRIYWRSESAAWWLDYYDAQGKRVRRSADTQDEKEARQKLERLVERERALKASREQTNLRLWDDVAFAYIESLGGKARNDAIGSAKRSRVVLEGLRLADIDTEETLDALFDHMALPRRFGEARVAQPYSAATQFITLNFVRAVFRHAGVRPKVLPDYKPVREFGARGHRERFATFEEETALAKACSHDWRWDYLSFAIDTGLRRNEQRRLTWSDVHLDHHTPHLQLSWGKTKKKRSRVVPLNARAIATLRRQPRFPNWSFVFWRPKRVSAGARRQSYSAPALVHDPYVMFREVCEAAGIPVGRSHGKEERLTFHDLRHTFAQRRLSEGMRIEVLSKIMGHARITMTMRYLSFQKDAVFDEFNRVQSELRAKSENWAQSMGTEPGTVFPLVSSKSR